MTPILFALATVAVMALAFVLTVLTLQVVAPRLRGALPRLARGFARMVDAARTSRLASELGGIPVPTDIGGHVKVVAGNVPVTGNTATLDGDGIDRTGYASCVLAVSVGLGTVTSVDCTLQDSADNVTFADYKPDGSNAAKITQITAQSKHGYLNVDLSGARQYIRAHMVTDGTAIATASEIILGGAATEPATNAQ